MEKSSLFEKKIENLFFDGRDYKNLRGRGLIIGGATDESN
jgi:hypothetical protein